MKIVCIAEDVAPPIDEGFKKFSYKFLTYICKSFINSICFSKTENSSIGGLKKLPKNKLLFSYKFQKEINNFKPDVIFYIPSSSYTLMSFIRLFVLGKVNRDTKRVIIGLQKRNYNKIEKLIIKKIKIDLIITFSNEDAAFFNKINKSVILSKAGVDTMKFKPVSEAKKELLRKKYKISLKKNVVLHVGHINVERNVFTLIDLKKKGYEVILVGSSSTESDENTKEKLIDEGVVIFDGFIQNIEEIYQLADVYLFPVLNMKSAIEFPLSVIEAMSCNLPVVSTKYGALPNNFSESPCFKYFESNTELFNKVEEILSGIAGSDYVCYNRKIILSDYSWGKVFDNLLLELKKKLNIQ